MKYIRTKDGVYKIDEVKSYFLDEKQKLFINNELKVAINEQRVINQSENLEELCDCFVIEWLPTNHKDIFCIDDYSKKVIESCIGNNKTNVYGAVWCEFGLKYIAKLNSKGEFELL